MQTLPRRMPRAWFFERRILSAFRLLLEPEIVFPAEYTMNNYNTRNVRSRCGPGNAECD